MRLKDSEKFHVSAYRRRRRQGPAGSRNNTDRWLLTYADLITLLLAFFIIMFSMSHLDAKRFGKVSQALAGILNGRSVNAIFERQFDDEEGSGPLKISRLRTMMRIIEYKAFEKGIDEKKFETEIAERGLVIHIMEQALFASSEATLSEKATDVLDLVASELKGIPNHIRVEGHTDNSPILTGKYVSNWELSSARATEVVRYLMTEHNISGKNISALGYGEFRPIRPNNTLANRAKNRRVDIVVLTMELSNKEPSASLFVPGKTP